MPAFAKTIRDEVISVIPAVIYFMIAFNLINYTEKLMLRPYDFDYVSCLTATVSALLVGKLLILINALPFFNLFPNRPLIYNVVWKVMVYAIGATIIRCLHVFITSLFYYHDLMIAWLHVVARLASPEFWAIQLWLLMLFGVYVVFSEISHALGRGKVRQLLFGQR